MSPESPSPPPNAAAFAPDADDVFGRIATRYDFLSDIFSFGIHRLWKRRVAQVIAAERWSTLLDGATGTGDIILRVLSYESVRGRAIMASDVSPQMLAIAFSRLAPHKEAVSLSKMNVEDMPEVPTESVDAYSVSLCLKICNRKQAMREAFRVLRPGGRFIILEASNIPWRPLHNTYLLYMELCMPVLGWIATGGDASAYRYLLQGIQDFPAAESLALELSAAGFAEVQYQRLSFGIDAIHTARQPQPSGA